MVYFIPDESLSLGRFLLTAFSKIKILRLEDFEENIGLGLLFYNGSHKLILDCPVCFNFQVLPLFHVKTSSSTIF